MGVEFKDYSKSMLKKMDAAELQALKNYGEHWGKVVDRVIVEKDIIDTGALRRSMKYQINQQEKTIKTGTFGDDFAKHAIYNELGTHKMKARPFLQPSVEEANGAFAEILRQEVNGEMSSTQGLTAEVKNL